MIKKYFLTINRCTKKYQNNIKKKKDWVNNNNNFEVIFGQRQLKWIQCAD